MTIKLITKEERELINKVCEICKKNKVLIRFSLRGGYDIISETHLEAGYDGKFQCVKIKKQ